jgi:hypothetical protein
MKKWIFTLAIFTVCSLSAQAQIAIVNPTFVDAGARVTVTAGAIMYIGGHAEIRAGRVDVQSLGRLIVEGHCSIWEGGLYLFGDGTGLIRGDLEIKFDGVCWRYKPGVLTIEGTIYNYGHLNNDGEINIGR